LRIKIRFQSGGRGRRRDHDVPSIRCLLLLAASQPAAKQASRSLLDSGNLLQGNLPPVFQHQQALPSEIYSIGHYRIHASISRPIHPVPSGPNMPQARVPRDVNIRSRTRIQKNRDAILNQPPRGTSPPKRQRQTVSDGAKSIPPPCPDSAADVSSLDLGSPLSSLPCKIKVAKAMHKSLQSLIIEEHTAQHPRLDPRTMVPWIGIYPSIDLPPHPDATRNYYYSIWDFQAPNAKLPRLFRKWRKWVSLTLDTSPTS
jgi:hypothetical protein